MTHKHQLASIRSSVDSDKLQQVFRLFYRVTSNENKNSLLPKIPHPPRVPKLMYVSPPSPALSAVSNLELSTGNEEPEMLMSTEDPVSASPTIVRRYPKRNRIKPTEFWRNHRPIYERDPVTLAFSLVGVEVGSKEDRPTRQLQKRKKTKFKPARHKAKEAFN